MVGHEVFISQMKDQIRIFQKQKAQQIWMGLGEFALQEFKGRHIPQNGL